MYSRWLRCSTARGIQILGITRVVQACKSFLFPESSNEVKIKNTCLVIIKELRMRSLVKLSGLVNNVTKMVTGCCKDDKSCYICSVSKIVKYEKYGTLSMYS